MDFLIEHQVDTNRKLRCPRDPYFILISDWNLIPNGFVRTYWASLIASASNVQRRLESPEAWIAHICKSKHPLINAMLRRYRFLNRNLFFHHFDVLVGCLFSFADIVFLNKIRYFRKHRQFIMLPKFTLFMPWYCQALIWYKRIVLCFSNNQHAIWNSIMFPCDAPGACHMSFFTLLSGKMGV